MSSSIPDVTDTQAYRHDDPVIDQALDWAVLLRAAGEPSTETVQAFERWLNENSDNRRAWENVSALWGCPEVMIASKGLKDVTSDPVPTAPRRDKTRSHRASWRVAALSAAMATLLLICGPSLYRSVSVQWQADYRTQTGQQQQVALPDGSRMILNTQSAVAVDFTGGKRNIRLLKGEAWFDVVHDSSRPFRVAANFSEVEVKGTAFAVDAGDGIDTVILERGFVVSRHENPEIPPVHLKAGEMLHATPTSLSPVAAFDPEEALGWREGRIALSNTPLDTALETIGRYYDGRIILVNRSLKNVTINGSYRTDNAEAAIDSAATAAGGVATHLPGGFIIIR